MIQKGVKFFFGYNHSEFVTAINDKNNSLAFSVQYRKKEIIGSLKRWTTNNQNPTSVC